MSTHDMNLANAAGASFRSDLNLALVALVSKFSSATEPADTWAYMWWIDTGNSLVKQRNADDDAWIVWGALDQTNDYFLPYLEGASIKTLLAAKADSSSLGTASTKDTGTASGEVPLNSDLGSASTKDTGVTNGDVPIIGAGDKLPESIIPGEAVKAWINFDSTGTISIRDSFNVTSITDNGVGDFTITWDTDFADVNYAWVGTSTGIGSSVSIGDPFASHQFVGSISIDQTNSLGGRVDRSYIGIIAMGDQ
jgi:hypothetical protein